VVLSGGITSGSCRSDHQAHPTIYDFKNQKPGARATEFDNPYDRRQTLKISQQARFVGLTSRRER
jgi:hypothetical protein